MKKKLLSGIIACSIILTAISISLSDSTGKFIASGATNENTCSQSGCHGAGQGGLADNVGPGSIAISCSNMPGWVYTPGQVYHLTVTVSQSACNLFGFSSLAVNNANANAGSMVVTDNVHTRSGTPYGSVKNYITHTGLTSASPGTATTSNPAIFNYDWTAPAINMGPIRFYFDGLAANNNLLEDAGDNVYSSSQVITPVTAVTSPLVMCTLNPSATFPFYLRTTTGTPSTPQNFDVAGLALTGNLIVSVSAPFEISTSSASGFAVAPINLIPSAGGIAATKIYIRYNPSLGGALTAAISVSSAGATSMGGYANGAIASPIISSPSVASLATFTTIVGTPSTVDSFTVTSSALVNNLVITAPAQFQISLHRNTGYLNSNSYPIFIPTWGYTAMKVYVRYNPSVAGTHTGNIVISSTGATSKSVAVVGISTGASVSEALSENNINVFPNPTSHSATLDFNLTVNQELNIVLKNIEGKEIKTISQTSFTKGNNQIAIDCSELAKGLYFIGITANNTTVFKKFIVE
jgi:Secretion system C-terminal sorting domain